MQYIKLPRRYLVRKTTMSPNKISILLSILVCGKADRGLARVDSPDTAENIRHFIAHGVIVYVDSSQGTYALTERGKLYVEYLQHIPLPRETKTWVMDQIPFPPEI